MIAINELDPRVAPARDLTSLKSLLGPHLCALEAHLKEEAEQFEPEIRELTRYCMAAGGKRIRASLVLLGGWQDLPEVRDDMVRLAVVVELVHLATLVHDDILDSASTRHQRMTAARKFGPTTAVLLGDAFFAQAVNLSTRFPDSEICRQISIATRRVCAGEITQTLRRGSVDLTTRDYYRIVELKTAELFSVSCRLGAYLAGFSNHFVSAVAEFGRRLGIAYQIYDDMVDFFGKEESAGKTLGTDIESGKQTLPIILLMDRLNPTEKRAFQEDLQSGNDNRIARRTTEMVDRGVFDEAVEAAFAETAAAENALAHFPNHTPTHPLLQISERLKTQVASLNSGKPRTGLLR